VVPTRSIPPLTDLKKRVRQKVEGHSFSRKARFRGRMMAE
jgi:hypothetical protein